MSLLAANGFYHVVWALCSDYVADGSAQPYTECQNTNGTLTPGTYIDGAGGTSAAAPAFAGILALVSQSQGGARLGQVNYVLYRLAQSAYSSVFHDITTGDNSVPCVAGSPDCGTNGFITGYNAGNGYDLTSGLGSIDVSKLIKSWGSVSLAGTTTTLQINGSTASVTAVHGTNLNLSVAVSPSSASGVVGISDTADETANGTAFGQQNNGQPITIPLTKGLGSAGYNGLPGGSYTVSARYGGDTADAESTSPSIKVTITPEASSTALYLVAANPQTGVAISNLSAIPYGSYFST